MIYVLHGDDRQAVYLKLQSIVSTLPKASQKIQINKDNLSQLVQTLHSQDLFNTPSILVLEDLISTKKINPKDLKGINPNQTVVLLENQQLSPAAIRPYQPIATVVNFKLPQTLFYFLDSLGTSPQKAISYLLKESDIKSLSWHLQNRLFLLIMAKLNISGSSVSQVAGRSIAPWQWEKITYQARAFSLQKLKVMFSAALKIETLIKTGATSIPEKTLVMLMLNKYTSSRAF